MKNTVRDKPIAGRKKRRTLILTARSGLKFNMYDDEWTLMPNRCRGHTLKVGWVHCADMPEDHRQLILGVYSFYARTKVCSTASTLVINTARYLTNGIPELSKIKALWSGLQTSHKKGLNQLFGTLSKQGNKRFENFHKYTSARLDKEKTDIFSPSKGALSDIEFDSCAKQINCALQGVNWKSSRSLDYYRSGLFNQVKNLVSTKLLLSIVRRPIQIATLKWADLLPTGASFHDQRISAGNELGTLGSQTLQLRVFIAKSKALSGRDIPERYPLHLSEQLSKTLSNYKEFYLNGVEQLLRSNGINMNLPELLELVNPMPMFPHEALWSQKVASIDVFKGLFTLHSTYMHSNEAAIAMKIKTIPVASERVPKCVVTNNRIRHTVLTRGAQSGLTAEQLAKITGVTVPAVRHYIDLDYASRRQIDSEYIGNVFLNKVFNLEKIPVAEDEDCIVDSNFNAVGGAKAKSLCGNCATLLGRPLGCYGCPNFQPIAEADHRAVLKVAEDKLAVNQSALLNPLMLGSIEKLKIQIEWVKVTIIVCDEALAKQRAMGNE